ncbi:MAG TPA: (d)CMP kinase [Pseudonocardiaceae bacterium]|nr:(d)CMP kinase [Pseudonocardiaceae bacterium]
MTGGRLHGVVALDGPSGTGKSTVAKRLARLLEARYLDTGAMYRAVTLAVLRARVALEDAEAIGAVATSVALAIEIDPSAPAVRLDGEDVGAEIRGATVTGAVSAVAKVAAVRSVLVGQQQRIVAEVLAADGGIVVEGRDIGTVVAPDAGLKVYLTASPEARAHRRSRQDAAAGRHSTVDETRLAVDRRDSLDTRTTPLRPAGDAVELDSTNLDVNGVLTALVSMVDDRGMRSRQSGERATVR